MRLKKQRKGLKDTFLLSEENNSMTILSTPGWSDYELLDTGAGKRLERFGSVVLSRPDPQCIWQPQLPDSNWLQADAQFRKHGDGGEWIVSGSVPRQWPLQWDGVTFSARLSPFKHTGVFPEQSLQWEWMKEKIVARKQTQEKISVLNLFGYTGIASVVCARYGAFVTHVDASKPSITWANENRELSGIPDTSIRWILDDCVKFVEREVRRGKRYDAIILDPPAFGHGPDGKAWKFHEHTPYLLSLCSQVLSDTPLFVLMNAYAISASALMLENLFNDHFGSLSGTIEVGELALAQKNSLRLLSTGIFARWEKIHHSNNTHV